MCILRQIHGPYHKCSRITQKCLVVAQYTTSVVRYDKYR